MPTKECGGFPKDKQKGFSDEKTNSGGQYSNLNLNHNQCHNKHQSIQSQSKSFSHTHRTKNTASTKVTDCFEKNEHQCKSDKSQWNKDNFVSKKLEQLNRNESPEKYHKHTNKKSSKSTLSLHITAYENSIEACNQNKQNNMKDTAIQKKKFDELKKWKGIKELSSDKSSITKNSYEFPRRQEQDSSEPEVMQFKASQRLLNPNELHSELENDSKAHRNNTQCSECQIRPLTGNRYKCTSCDNYYLCQSCYDSNGHNDTPAPAPAPAPNSVRIVDAVIHEAAPIVNALPPLPFPFSRDNLIHKGRDAVIHGIAPLVDALPPLPLSRDDLIHEVKSLLSLHENSHTFERTYNGRVFKDYEPWHEIVRCNGCSVLPIIANRYQCHTCQDYDLCQQCYHDHNFGEDNTTHNEIHAMRMIPSKLDAKSIHFSAGVCNGCGSENFYGNYNRCNECDNYTLCQRCFEEDRFSPDEANVVNHSSLHEMTVVEPETRNHSDYDKWVPSAIKMQNYYGSTYGSRNWDIFDADNDVQWKYFGIKIGFVFFGPPTTDDENSDFFYLPEQEEHIKKLREHILKIHKETANNNVVSVNFIYVSYWNESTENMFPLIRLQKSEECYFIERNCRTYHSWKNFLDTNQLPAATICFPMDGWYSPDRNGFCLLSFSKSANCDTSRKICESHAARNLSMATPLLAIIALPLSPGVSAVLSVTGSVAGACETAKDAYTLYDHYEHDQSINPFKDEEARCCWLSIAGTAFSVGLSVGTNYLVSAAKSGRHVNQLVNHAITAAKGGVYGSCVIGIVAHVMHIYQKYNKEKKIPKLEIIQLSASIFSFLNIILTQKTAEKMIEEYREIHKIRESLPTHNQKLNFDRYILKDTTDGKVDLKSAKISLGRLRKLMKDSEKWEEFFGHDKCGQAAERHGAQPSNYAVKDYADILVEEVAIKHAKKAHLARYSGKKADVNSINTILALPSHELDDKLKLIFKNTKNIVYKNGQADFGLPGRYYGYNIEINGNGEVISIKTIQVDTPHFSMNQKSEQFVHYNPGLSSVKEVPFPANVPLSAIYSNKQIMDIPFCIFYPGTTVDKKDE